MSAEGDRLAREGEQRAYDAAMETWKQEAKASLYAVTLIHLQFTTDEVWDDLDRRNIVGPREPRAIAGVMRFGANENWCYVTDRTKKSERAVRHSRPLQIWVSKNYSADAVQEERLFDPAPFAPVQGHFDV